MINLSIDPGVILTPSISRTIELMDKHFKGEPSKISSGLRTPHDQIRIITEKLVRHGHADEFLEFSQGRKNNWSADTTVHLPDIDRDLFWWQRGWSRLLNLGDIINPPVPAEVMFDYFRPGNPKNKKGEVIQISPHQRGTAFDIRGEGSLLEKSKCVVKAVEARDCFIKSWLLEHVNNACHIDCFLVGGGAW